MKKIVSGIVLFVFSFFQYLPAFSLSKTEENNYLSLKRTSRHLHSRLSKDYTGYEYKLKNVYDKPINVQSISVWDNASSKVAYLSVKRTGARAAAETLGTGVALALPTLTLSLIGSVIAVPFIIVSNQIGNIGANQEAKRYDKRQDSSFTINPKEEIVFKTMALRMHKPSVKIVFTNPITEENMTLDMQK